MKLFSTLTFMLLSCISFSQAKFLPGYIVGNNDDTSKGYIQQLPEEEIEKKVIFKTSEESNTTTFDVTQLKSFGFNDGNTFHRISYTNPNDNSKNEQFAKLLLKGYYTVYSIISVRHYFLITSPDDSIYFLNDVYYTYSGIVEEPSNFRNQLYFLSRNCNDLKNKIENVDFSSSDIISFVEKINRCVSPSSTSEIAYKKEKSKFDLYAYAGGIVLSDRHQYVGRISARFTIPAIDTKTSFNISLGYINNQTTNSIPNIYTGGQMLRRMTTNIINMPVTIQYAFTKGFIQPYVDAGASLAFVKTDNTRNSVGIPTSQSKFVLGLTGAIGIDGFISKNFFAKAEWRYYNWFGYNTDAPISYYPTLGIGYFFTKR